MMNNQLKKQVSTKTRKEIRKLVLLVTLLLSMVFTFPFPWVTGPRDIESLLWFVVLFGLSYIFVYLLIMNSKRSLLVVLNYQERQSVGSKKDPK